MESVPTKKLVDFIDGKLRNKTAEEYVRQNVERSLVQEYQYPREEIAVEFAVKLGSSRKRVDLAVFEEGRPKHQDHIILLVECKKEGTSIGDKRDGLAQLQSYMSACPNCRYGLWTNGTDERVCIRRDESSGRVEFQRMVDIPPKGREYSDVDEFDRQKLRLATGDNLLLAFKRCHNYIAGNQGLQKPEAFWELLKVIFAKIEDERSLTALSFYVTSKEQEHPDGQLRCKKRIDGLFTKVRKKFPTIFKAGDEIELNRTVLAYIVSQLHSYSLLDSTVDVKGVAYEEIVGANLRGDRGEFFTPRNACVMAVQMLDPHPNALVIDPALGTGGFLVTAMNHVLQKFDDAKRTTWRNPLNPTEPELSELFRSRQEMMASTFTGLDINPALVRAAKMNMVMNNDGAGGLTQADSLRNPVNWSREARRLAPLDGFDFLFTNPPFGTQIRIDSPEVLEQYELAAVWDVDADTGMASKRLRPDGRAILQASQPPEILFIERCLNFLKPGTGRMAIVIPNGILNNLPLAYVRKWILANAELLAVVDMQRDLFQPKNDTQTSMVLLRRLSESEKANSSRGGYPIFMAVTDKVGRDKRGKEIYKRDETGEDIVTASRIKVTAVENGKAIERHIEETKPIVDDQLSEIPGLFREWCRDQGRA